MTTTSPCGCATAPDPASGVLRSVAKCARHQAMRRDPATLDEAYYTELGVLKDGKLADTAHVAELVEALGELPKASERTDALEIGAGASPYVEMVRAAGYRYWAIDRSEWATRWLRETHRALALGTSFEKLDKWIFHGECSLILAAHVFEHMDDAPGGIARCADLLAPGGELWVIVPDDSDLLNPDHNWAFDQNTLRRCVESAGLIVTKIAMRKYVKHENFIYCRAQKPS